jgi:hypothetical protein
MPRRIQVAKHHEKECIRDASGYGIRFFMILPVICPYEHHRIPESKRKTPHKGATDSVELRILFEKLPNLR